MRMLLMSRRLGTVLLHHRDKAIKQVADFMWPWLASGCPWKLNAFTSERSMPRHEPSKSDLCVNRTWAGNDGLIRRKPMVLAGDIDLPVSKS